MLRVRERIWVEEVGSGCGVVVKVLLLDAKGLK